MPLRMNKDPQIINQKKKRLRPSIEEHYELPATKKESTLLGPLAHHSPDKKARSDFEQRGKKKKHKVTATVCDEDLRLLSAERDMWKMKFLNAEAERKKLDEASTVSKNEAVKIKEHFWKMTEDQLQCSVCSEIFVDATTLNCGHTFCYYCICEWQKKSRKSTCPLCRSEIRHTVVVRALDEFVNQVYRHFGSEGEQVARTSLKEERLKLRREIIREAKAWIRLHQQRSERRPRLVLIRNQILSQREGRVRRPHFEVPQQHYPLQHAPQHIPQQHAPQHIPQQYAPQYIPQQSEPRHIPQQHNAQHIPHQHDRNSLNINYGYENYYGQNYEFDPSGQWYWDYHQQQWMPHDPEF